MAATIETIETLEQATGKYKYGFVTDIESDKAPKGLNEDIIRFISAKKDEPEWMLEWRLKAFAVWQNMDSPDWAKLDIPRSTIRTPIIMRRQRHLMARHRWMRLIRNC